MRWIVSLLLSAWAGTTFAAVPLTGFRTKVYYLEYYQSNQLVSLAAQAPENSTIFLGPGDFAVSDSIYMTRKGIKIIGQGREVTRIIGPAAADGAYGAIYILQTNSVLKDLSLYAHIPIACFDDCTNSLVEDCFIQGRIDILYGPSCAPTQSGDWVRFKGCWFAGAVDFIMVQAGNPASTIWVEDTQILADSMIDFAGEFPGRSPKIFTMTQGTLRARNVNIVFTNCLNGQVLTTTDSGSGGPARCRVHFDNVTHSGAATNLGIVFPWLANPVGQGGTNTLWRFSNVTPWEYATNRTIITNGYGPTVVTMTGDPGSAINPGLTNWIPDLMNGGINKANFQITIKDGTGRAAGTNISIRTANTGQLIDAANNITINVNFGSVTIAPRPGTTNWMVLSRGQ